MIHSYGRCMKKTYQSHGSVMEDDLQQKTHQQHKTCGATLKL